MAVFLCTIRPGETASGVSSSREVVRRVEITRLPWTVGRSSTCSLVLEGRGVWDRHLTFTVSADDGLVVRAELGALARVGGEPFRQHRVRSGDVLQFGDICMSVGLAPPRRKSLGVWTWVFWALMTGVAVSEIVLVFRLAYAWFSS